MHLSTMVAKGLTRTNTCITHAVIAKGGMSAGALRCATSTGKHRSSSCHASKAMLMRLAVLETGPCLQQARFHCRVPSKELPAECMGQEARLGDKEKISIALSMLIAHSNRPWHEDRETAWLGLLSVLILLAAIAC